MMIVISKLEAIKLWLFSILLLLNEVGAYKSLFNNVGLKHRRQSESILSGTYYNSQEISSSNIVDMNDENEKAWDQIDFGLINATIAEWSKPMPIEYTTMPLVIAGPSGVGKNRLIRALLKDYSRFFQRVTTYTTRKPRSDEINGQDYHFVSEKQFLDLNTSNPEYFLETAYVHDNIYGVCRDDFYNITHKQNKIAILEIDVKGVQMIKKLAPTLGLQPRFLFIAPESIERLRERLHLRCTEKNDEIELRLRNAVTEIEIGHSESLFDEIIINADFNEATNALFRLVRRWYPTMPNAGRIRALQRKMRNLKQDLRRRQQEQQLL